MASDDASIPVHDSALQILQANGLRICARFLCKEYGLRTLEDIGAFTAYQINSVELETSLKSKLRELVQNCGDVNEYKNYRVSTLRREACAKRVLANDSPHIRQADTKETKLAQTTRERRDAVHKSTFLPHER
jgi:hypothetical protein